MKNVVLSRNSNILKLHIPYRGENVVYPANQPFTFNVSYQDKFRKAVANQRLMWSVVEGGAQLRYRSTVTTGEGKTSNVIMVPMDEPEDGTTVRIAVWPVTEPEARLEIDFNFGVPSNLDVGWDEDGNSIQIVFPRNNKNDSVLSYNANGGVTYSYVSYADKNGYSPIDGSFTYSYASNVNTNGTRDKFNLSGSLLYKENLYVWEAIQSWQGIPGDKLYLTADSDTTNMLSDATVSVSDTLYPTSQVNTFWPRPGATLAVGELYDLKALYCGGDGKPFVGDTVKWTVLSGDALIFPARSETDSEGVATTQIRPGSSGQIRLEVSIDGVTEGGSFKFDYPVFQVTGGAAALTITQPSDASIVLTANEDQDFSVKYVDGNGTTPAGARVDWTADGGQYASLVHFDPPYSFTDASGIAKSTLKSKNIPQGKKIDVNVTAATSDATAQQTYHLGANQIVFQAPDPNETYPLNKFQSLTVKYLTWDNQPLGQEYIDWSSNPAEDFQTVYFSNDETRTDDTGLTTTGLKVSKDMTISVTAKSKNPNETGTTQSFKFGSGSLAVVSPAPGAVLAYDSWNAVKVKVTDANDQPVNGATLSWSGGDFEHQTTTTVADGTSTNNIRVETANGYPSAPTVVNITVQAQDPAMSGGASLTFDKAATTNQIKFLSPSANAALPTGQPITLTVQLTNIFGTNLANYDVKWSSNGNIQFNSATSQTLADGTATVKMTASDGTTSATVVATAVTASAKSNRTYQFKPIELPDFSLLSDQIYAHNLPKDGPVDTNDPDTIITFTARCLANNTPQPNVGIIWSTTPRIVGLRYFREDGIEVSPNAQGNIVINTNEDGLSVLKLGSSDPFLGRVTALTEGSAQQLWVAIATIQTQSSGYVSLPVPLIQQDPITIPTNASNEVLPIFTTVTGSNPNRQRMGLWIKAGQQESVITQPALPQTVEFDVPYSYFVPDDGGTRNNAVAYWQGDVMSGNMFQSPMLQPSAQGAPSDGAHPDYSNPNRILPAPYLHDHANTVNGNSIAGGLTIYIPFNSAWTAGDVINGWLYLNGYNGNTAVRKWGTVPFSRSINANDVNDGQAGEPVKVLVPQENLEGYGSYRGDYGSFEADYQAPNGWSDILGEVTLDTATWS
ncbi:Ig-like domain-containing protein [Phyllobacterium phragmitis]|uniref:Uncharacterized protein n=1 Tax=Phyllobacterium phragmitis TaxID=2670329 RepID=A0ABQ0H4L3_9HYPH